MCQQRARRLQKTTSSLCSFLDPFYHYNYESRDKIPQPTISTCCGRTLDGFKVSLLLGFDHDIKIEIDPLIYLARRGHPNIGHSSIRTFKHHTLSTPKEARRDESRASYIVKL